MTDPIAERNLPAAPETLPAPCIDAHTHMDSTVKNSGLQVEENIATAASVGIERIVHIGCDVEGARWAEQVASQHDTIVAAVAIHPNDIARMDDQQAEEAWALIDRLASAGDHVRAIGETGMDRYRTREEAGIARQAESFARHIQMAKDHDLALSIHDRDAHDDVLAILDSEGWPDRVIFHCFSGDADFARTCLDRGAWLSFAGNVTYKANKDIQEAMLLTPADRLLLETDAPYLTPLPHRGKPNAPYLLPNTIRYIAERRGDELGQLCASISAATEDVYGGPWGGGALHG